MSDDGARPLLALALMVKDEARSFAAIVASARPQVDRLVVLDTGSRDGTLELARAALAEVPGVLVEEPFVDFATSRNRCLELAEREAEFVLTLSGDETLHDPAGELRRFCERERAAPPDGALRGAFNVRVAYGGLAFDQVRLVRAGAGWRYAGVVHEVLCRAGAPTPARRVPGDVEVRHAGADPERKRLRLYKDLELLREQIRRAPDDARAQFYAAQTLEDLGMHAQAHEGYARRVRLGGWVEEAYEAAYRVARTARVLGRPWPEVQQLYLDAHALDPRRAEPLFEVAQHWHLRGAPVLAWLFAARAAALPYPEACVLFVQPDVYRWRAARLAAIVAARVGEASAAATLAARVLGVHPDDAEMATLAAGVSSS